MRVRNRAIAQVRTPHAGSLSGDEPAAGRSHRSPRRSEFSSHFPVLLALRRLASLSIYCPVSSGSRVSMETPAHRPTPSMSVLLERGGQVFFVVGVNDNDREQPCRRGRACIAADAMDGARRLVPTFARAVDPLRFVIHL